MTESKSMILGCAGQIAYAAKKSISIATSSPGASSCLRAISASPSRSAIWSRRCVTASDGRDAPVFIDQEGGRVQRLRPPLGAELSGRRRARRALSRRTTTPALRAAWLMARLHAFDLLRFGITADCLPVLDVPIDGASDVIGGRAYGKDPAAWPRLAAPRRRA